MMDKVGEKKSFIFFFSLHTRLKEPMLQSTFIMNQPDIKQLFLYSYLDQDLIYCESIKRLAFVKINYFHINLKTMRLQANNEKILIHIFEIDRCFVQNFICHHRINNMTSYCAITLIATCIQQEWNNFYHVLVSVSYV